MENSPGSSEVAPCEVCDARATARAGGAELCGKPRGILLKPKGICVLAVLALWFWPSCGEPLMAQTASSTEYELKAAFLLNFAKFVEWPANVFQNAKGRYRSAYSGTTRLATHWMKPCAGNKSIIANCWRAG